MRSRLSLLLLLLLTAHGLGCSRPPAAGPKPDLNLVFIVVDTLRADHLGCYGYRRATSPNVDRLAQGSALFEQAQSHSSWTMPSVASMFTSLEPKDHGIVDWKQALDTGLLTLAEHLKARGWRTEGYVSHGVLSRLYQFDQGFDVYDSSVVEGRLPRDITTAREVTDLALQALPRLAAGPQRFFMWVHYFDPHDAYLEHPQHPYGPRPADRYDSEIAWTDRHVGRLLDGLKQQRLDERTLVVFVADHGEGFGAHRHLYHTVTLYEELLRVPLLLRVPGLASQRVAEPVALLDLAPTLLQLLGEPLPAEFRGRPVPLREGRFQPDPERRIVAETQRFADLRSLRVGRYKLIHDRAKGGRRLFDLQSDPGERHNLRRQRPELAAALLAELEAHYARGVRQVPGRDLPPDVEEKLRSLGYVK